MYKDCSFLAVMGEWGEMRHSTATGGRIKWLQKKWLLCLLLSTVYFQNFCCDSCWIPPWRGEGGCFVCAGSEIYHCSLFSAGSMCEHESCALIQALHPWCIPSELVLKPPLLYPTLWVCFALALLPVLLPPAPTMKAIVTFYCCQYTCFQRKKCITCPLAGAGSHDTAVFYMNAYRMLPLHKCTYVYSLLTFEKHQGIWDHKISVLDNAKLPVPK